MHGGGQWRGTIAHLCRRDSDAFPHVAARQTSLCGRSDTLLETVSRGAKRCPRGQICQLTPLKAAAPTLAARIPPVNFETVPTHGLLASASLTCRDRCFDPQVFFRHPSHAMHAAAEALSAAHKKIGETLNQAMELY